MTSNEIRQIMGMKPSEDPKADQLVNSNISQPVEEMPMEEPYMEEPLPEEAPIEEEPPSLSGADLGNMTISELKAMKGG